MTIAGTSTRTGVNLDCTASLNINAFTVMARDMGYLTVRRRERSRKKKEIKMIKAVTNNLSKMSSATQCYSVKVYPKYNQS